MRFASVASEAWRDSVSGTSRAGLWGLVFVALVGLVALMDARSIVSVLQGAEAFKTSGASVSTINSPDSIDGARCDHLAGHAGVGAAGAFRQADPVTIWNLPSTPVGVIEATPGFITLLAQIGTDVKTENTNTGGVWLSSDLAATLGVAPGATIQTSAGPAVVAGVYTWPDDGRVRDLGYTMITPVPATGLFTQCWAQVWPPDASASSLLYMGVNGTPEGNTQATFGQVNPTLGASYDAASLLAHRVTAPAPWIGAIIGLVIGFAAGWTRRLEIASSLHARVPRAHLIWQHLIETSIWVAGGVIIAAATLLWASRIDNSDTSIHTWLTSLRTITTGATTTLIGVVGAVGSTREKALFRYAKDR